MNPVGLVQVMWPHSLKFHAAFQRYTVDEHLDNDFGQGTNGVVVTGDGGSIGLGLADVPSDDYLV